MYIFSKQTLIETYTEIHVDIFLILTNILSKIVLRVKMQKNHKVLVSY